MATKKRLCQTISLPNGKRKYIYGYTKAELEKKVLQARLELGAGVDISDKTTFGELAQLWFDTYKKGRFAPNTEKTIKARINNHAMPILADMEVRNIKPIHCARVFKQMDDKNLGNGLQTKVHNDLTSIFDMAVDNGLIVRSPITKSVVAGGRKTKKREALTDTQVATLLAGMKDYSITEQCMTEILLHTGMRIGELLCLQWSDIDIAAQVIHVRHTTVWTNSKNVRSNHPKTDAGNRDIPYGNTVRKALATLKLNDDTSCHYVIQKYGREFSFSEYQTYCRHLGKQVAGCTPHILRHTAITNWVTKQGMTIIAASHIAGHANTSVTADIYSSYTSDTFKDTAERIRSFG